MGTVFVTARVDQESKSKAEQALHRSGLSSSQAVRRLYDYIGSTGEVPDFLLADPAERLEKKRRRIVVLDRFRNNRLPVTVSDEEVRSLLDEAREERFA